jgi:hypothetical protein
MRSPHAMHGALGDTFLSTAIFLAMVSTFITTPQSESRNINVSAIIDFPDPLGSTTTVNRFNA